MTQRAIKRGYLATAAGRIHYAACGSTGRRLRGTHADGGHPPAALLLHQTPRSWDEYREVLVPLARGRRVVALDTLGYGASDPPARGHSIEAYADGVLGAADALGLDRFDLVGHHTGGIVAVEVAARQRDRVRKLVLSSTVLIDAAERERRARSPHALDAFTPADDGSHLLDLWNGRARFYPRNRPDLLDRYLRDALRADDPAAGHRAVAAYRMEDRLPLVRADVLCVGHEQDPHAIGSLEPLAGLLRAGIRRIPDGHVPLEHTADAFVTAIDGFLTTA